MMTLTDQLERLASFEPAPYPVTSLYLSAKPDQIGRDRFAPFVRKEFAARSRTYPPGSPDREAIDRDFERIAHWLATELEPSANSVAIFACSPAHLFETVQAEAGIDRHWLSIGSQPHLYPLARMVSQHPRYAAVLADTNLARIVVIAAGEVVANEEVQGVKTRRSQQGGWSQARFQRHVENFHLHHAKEAVAALDRIVREEEIDQIILAGDEVIIPLLRAQLPKHLADCVVDQIRLDTHAPLAEVVDASLAAMARLNTKTDRERVEAAVNAYRSGGLGVVGPEATLEAIEQGRLDELLVSASVDRLRAAHGRLAAAEDEIVPAVAAGEAAMADAARVRLANDLVTGATRTGARITFIEDPALLDPFGGVAGLLRFRL